MNAIVYGFGYIFIIGKHCTDYIDGVTLTILKFWESNVEVTDIGYNLIGLGLVSLWWFKDHLRLLGL